MSKNFNKASMVALRRELTKVLEPFGKTVGIDIQLGRGRYNAMNASFTLELAVLNEAGEAETPERVNFKQSAKWHGLSPEMLDQTFQFRGVTHTVCGLKTGGQKFPVLAKNPEGKVFLFPVATIQKEFGFNPAVQFEPLTIRELK